MLKPSLLVSWLLLLLCLGMGCSRLSYVSNYSTASIAALQDFEKLDYSFLKACEEKCLLEQLDEQELLADACSCNPEKNADSVILELFTAIQFYVKGLHQLSENKLTRYNFESLAKNMTAGKIGNIAISEKQAAAFQKISATLTHAISNQYRKKKLKQYIAEADEPLQVLIDALQFNLVSNLGGRLNTQQERIRIYTFDLFKNSTLSAYDKKLVIEQYRGSIANIEARRKQLTLLSQQLGTIGKGHNDMYKNRYRLSDKNTNLAGRLAEYSATLSKLITEFNTLKKL